MTIRGRAGEEWRPIPDWEGYYEVSNYGRVWSCRRTIETVDGRVYERGGMMIRLCYDKRVSIVRAMLSRHNKQHGISVGNAVLAAFSGIMQPGFFAAHKDLDWANCHLDNLEWRTANQFQNTPERRCAAAKKSWSPERREAQRELSRTRMAAWWANKRLEGREI